jgi:antirestriction protein ArdC
LLIAIQRPDATQVAGYQKWQQLGRQVNIGEKGIRILAPITYKQSSIKKSDEHPEDSQEVRVLRAFRSVSVFDISQTSGDPLPHATTRLLGPEPVHAFRRLEVVAGELGFHVGFTELRGQRNGECDFENREIRIRTGIDAAQVAKTLAHELGHALLHFPSEMPAGGLSRDIAELEAESVAYVVCHELGLDSSEYSLGYIANWAGDGQRAVWGIERSAGRINKAAHTILAQMESTTHGVAEPTAEYKPSFPFQTLGDEITTAILFRGGAMEWPTTLHRPQLVRDRARDSRDALVAPTSSRAQIGVDRSDMTTRRVSSTDDAIPAHVE